MGRSKKPVVMVVEDETMLNEAYCHVLKHDGYSVLSARDGQEALDLTAENMPDLILLDLRMPRMDGLTFLKKFNPKKHPETKIIVFSNYDAQDDIDQSFRLGATHYILKAFASPKELVKAVKDTLKS